MTVLKLSDGTIINATTVELVSGVLKISTTEKTVEELAGLFSDKNNTNLITLMTEAGVESGFKAGFTSFAGITYGEDGLKTVELFQPKDATDRRISNAEATANIAITNANITDGKVEAVAQENAMLSATVDSILTDVIPSLMA